MTATLEQIPAQGASHPRDLLGRPLRDLRISVTDRCNFRCTYCMPEEGMEWIPRSEVLIHTEPEESFRPPEQASQGPYRAG